MATDQATTLRLMAASAASTLDAEATTMESVAGRGAALPNTSCATRTIAVTSGKGGVGKSNVAANLALELAALSRRVSLLDADLALANADVLLGLNPQFHLGHVLSGQRTLHDVVLKISNGVRLIPGGSGVEELANLSGASHTRLIAELSAMEDESDYMIVDTAAGIGANVTGVLRAASEVIVVTTPDPTSVVDAYAIIKVLHAHAPAKPISLIVNQVIGVGDSEAVYAQLRQAAARFLNHHIEHLGAIPRDSELAEAVREQTPVVEYAPQASSSRAIKLIAKHLDNAVRHNDSRHNPPASFWHSMASTPA